MLATLVWVGVAAEEPEVVIGVVIEDRIEVKVQQRT